MKNTLGIKIAADAAFAALAGCTDLKPLQADIDSLKTQVGKLSSDMAGKADKSALDATNTQVTAAATAARNAQTAATAAQTSANAASSKADAAQAAANAASSKADQALAADAATNEKLDRMFKKTVSK